MAEYSWNRIRRHQADVRTGSPYLAGTDRSSRVIIPELLLLLSALVPEEVDLAAALRSGDRMAFRAFFDRYHADLLRYLKYRNVPDELAEDLVQQAFVTIWEKRDSLRDDGSVRGLLFRIAYTRALNHFRDTARLERLGDPEETVSADASPEDAAEGRLMRERLKAAVAALPERRRAVFELCMLEGLSYRETAESLEISIKTVENQMAHALRAVREALAVHRSQYSPDG